MDYLRRQKALGEAINRACQGRPREEKDAEFDRLTELLQALVRESAEMAKDIIDRMFGAESGAPETRMDRILTCMREVNRMGEAYGTEPMFPEAETEPDYREIRNALRSYIDQIRS